MITGFVRRREARIRLTIRGVKGKEKVIDAVIDTGFTAWLTLPSKWIAALALPRRGSWRGELADGSERLFDVYEAVVKWGRSTRRILVNESDANPLVGMGLLDGHELTIQVRPRGRVTIKRLA